MESNNDNNQAKGQTMRSYYIAKKIQDNGMGFGYQTKIDARELWDGKGWTTDNTNAIRFVNSPQARMLVAQISDAEIISM